MNVNMNMNMNMYIYNYTCMMHCHPIFVPSRLSLTGKGNILPTRKSTDPFHVHFEFDSYGILYHIIV